MMIRQVASRVIGVRWAVPRTCSVLTITRVRGHAEDLPESWKNEGNFFSSWASHWTE